MGKWKVKEGAESILVIKCAKCGHVQGNHIDTSSGKPLLTKCSRCDCKEFKFKTKDKLKGLFSKRV